MALMDVTVNETRILNAIWLNPGISRAEIARQLNLNKSTVTKISNGLLEQQVISLAESPDVLDTKGRRPTGMFINSEIGVTVGIEIQTESWNAVVLYPDGQMLHSFKSESFDSETPVLDSIRNAIDSSIEEVGMLGKHLLGVGIGLSGQINPYSGVILSSNPLNVHEPLPLTDILAGEYPFQVLVENDANCCCWNVLLEKKAERHRNFLCILGEYRRTSILSSRGGVELQGIAVGMGLVIKDSVLHGDRFSAGEFQSLFKDTENPTQFELDTDSLEKISTDKEVRRKIIWELARNTSLVVNMLNISMIKIFGNFIEDPQYMKETFGHEIHRNWQYQDQIDFTVEISDQGQDSVAIGAAGYFLNRVFSLPDIWEERDTAYPGGVELLRSAIYKEGISK